MNLEQLNNFFYGWQFFDDDGNCLFSSKDLEKISLLNNDESMFFWKKYISAKYFHLAKIPIDIFNFRLALKRINVDWNNEKEQFDISQFKSNEEIIFLFGSKSGMKLTWGIFIKIWREFFYSCDDNSVILVPNQMLMIFYIEQTVTLYNMTENFANDLI